MNYLIDNIHFIISLISTTILVYVYARHACDVTLQ